MSGRLVMQPHYGNARRSLPPGYVPHESEKRARNVPTSLRSSERNGTEPEVHVLVLTPDDMVPHWTVGPLRNFAPWLRIRHGVKLTVHRRTRLSALADAIKTSRCDVAVLMTDWKESFDDTARVFESLHSDPQRPKIIYYDTFDSTSTPYFGLLPFVDLYVKKQLLTPLNHYRDDLAGGNVMADYFVRNHGFDLDGWEHGSTLPLEFESKIALGWNLGSANILLKGLLQGYAKRKPKWEDRKLDVHYRVNLTSEEGRDWYSFHRLMWRDALAPLEGKCRTVAKAGRSGRIPLEQFNEELQSSKIMASPFGWGEITDRDFHAVNNLSLLVKPDMSHLVTEPNIFVPGETYVPVKWDGSDLVETCLEYLDSPEKTTKIAEGARRACREWWQTGRPVARFLELLRHVVDGEPLNRWGQASSRAFQ